MCVRKCFTSTQVNYCRTDRKTDSAKFHSDGAYSGGSYEKSQHVTHSVCEKSIQSVFICSANSNQNMRLFRKDRSFPAKIFTLAINTACLTGPFFLQVYPDMKMKYQLWLIQCLQSSGYRSLVVRIYGLVNLVKFYSTGSNRAHFGFGSVRQAVTSL